MKSKVEFSTTSILISTLVILLFAAILFFFIYRHDAFLICFQTAFIAVMAIGALWYSPMYISVDNDALSIHRSLRIKDIPLNEIASIRLCPPTMGEQRICGSGGFFGYWGWFGERDLGRYFAYYGKASDCFFVTLKNGRKYMLGCSDPDAVVAAIEAKIDKARTNPL